MSIFKVPLLGLALLASTGAASACTPPTPTTNQMAIVTPCSPTLVTANQKAAPALTGIAMASADFMLYPNQHQTVQVQAPGMVNVEVWRRNALAVRLTSDGVGGFSGTIDTSTEKNGPVEFRILAWNAAPGDNTYTVNLAASFNVFIRLNNNEYWPPTPVAATGMTLKWREAFDSQTYKLSATPCKPGTGVWPNCAKPTAADGLTWYENKPDGGDFGLAAFEHTDGPFNPYTIFQGGLTHGWLRVRATFDPNYIDPYGYHRHWRSGLLAAAFPDGSSNLPPMGNGYYEARVLIPTADASWKTSASGGTWTSVWTLSRTAITNRTIGNIEWDIGEWYGVDGRVLHANEWDYSPATGPNGAVFAGQPAAGVDLSWEPHRYGWLVTDTTVTAYFDDKPLGTKAKGQFPGGLAINPYPIIDHAMGSGWPTNPPPAGYFDMWINYFEYYAP